MSEQPGEGAKATTHPDLFRMLVENVRDYAIFHLDPQGYIQSWNEGARRIKGYDDHEIIGRHFSIFYLPNEARQGKPAYELAVATDEGKWEEEGWRLRKDGSRFWANVVITALYDTDGGVLGFAKVTRDLTERKRAEELRTADLERERQAREAAEEALAELQAIQSLTETALTRFNLNDVIDELLARIQGFMEVDAMMVHLLNDPGDHLIPAAAAGVNVPIAQMQEIPLGMGLAGQIARTEEPLTIVDVTRQDVFDPALQDIGIRSWLGVPLMAANQLTGVIMVGSHHHRYFGPSEERFLEIVADRVALAIDRSRLIEAEQHARIDAELADARLRAQDAFLTIAAHELRSPTAAVKAAVQLLIRRIEKQHEADARAMLPVLEMASVEADRLTRLVDKLIESVRIDAGEISLEPVHTDLVRLVRRVVATAGSTAAPDQIVIHSPDELWLRLDPGRIEEVLTNLLENAIKYGDADRIDVEVGRNDDNTVCFSVRDHGAGVPEDQRHQLFDRFYQGAYGTGDRGLGLGLYISREIVTAHAGTIHVDFPPDGGSLFTVTLPG